jgi:hypothetical protein
VNPQGNGVVLLFDIAAAWDLALRVAVSIARLRGIMGTTP